MLTSSILLAGGARADDGRPSPGRESAVWLEGSFDIGVMWPLIEPRNGGPLTTSEPEPFAGYNLSGRFGGRLTPRWGLFVIAGLAGGQSEADYSSREDLPGLDFPGPVGVSELSLGFGARLAVHRRGWVESSLATTRLTVDEINAAVVRHYWGPRASAVAGVTVYEGFRIDLDAHLVVSRAFYDGGAGTWAAWLGLGVTTW